MFLALRSINTVEVIKAIFNFNVTFAIQSYVNQTLFVITRWIKNVKLAPCFFFFSSHKIWNCGFSLPVRIEDIGNLLLSFSSVFW